MSKTTPKGREDKKQPAMTPKEKKAAKKAKKNAPEVAPVLPR